MRLKSKVGRKCKGQFIFSVTQQVSYPFACHVGCKVTVNILGR